MKKAVALILSMVMIIMTLTAYSVQAFADDAADWPKRTMS